MATQPPQYQFIAEMLLKQIADGTYVLGGRLPTETQLAAEHGLARETIRRALGRLEQLGMIERRPGAGTTVVATSPVGRRLRTSHLSPRRPSCGVRSRAKSMWMLPLRGA